MKRVEQIAKEVDILAEASRLRLAMAPDLDASLNVATYELGR